MSWIPRDMDGKRHYEWIDYEWVRFKVRVAISWRWKYYRWLLTGKEFLKR